MFSFFQRDILARVMKCKLRVEVALESRTACFKHVWLAVAF